MEILYIENQCGTGSDVQNPTRRGKWKAKKEEPLSTMKVLQFHYLVEVVDQYPDSDDTEHAMRVNANLLVYWNKNYDMRTVRRTLDSFGLIPRTFKCRQPGTPDSAHQPVLRTK